MWFKLRAGMEAGGDGKLYSNDLRERVAGSVASGRLCRETARLFGVSLASVVKGSQRQRATESAAADTQGGRRERDVQPWWWRACSHSRQAAATKQRRCTRMRTVPVAATSQSHARSMRPSPGLGAQAMRW
jgi:transposase